MFSVIVLLGPSLFKFVHEIGYILYPAISPSIILAILMILGVAMRKPKLLMAHIIMSIAYVLLFILFIVGFSIYLSVYTYNTGVPIIVGLLASLSTGIFFIYWLGFVVALQTILKKSS